jgi:hypothetical protein
MKTPRIVLELTDDAQADTDKKDFQPKDSSTRSSVDVGPDDVLLCSAFNLPSTRKVSHSSAHKDPAPDSLSLGDRGEGFPLMLLNLCVES